MATQPTLNSQPILAGRVWDKHSKCIADSYCTTAPEEAKDYKQTWQEEYKTADGYKKEYKVFDKYADAAEFAGWND